MTRLSISLGRLVQARIRVATTTTMPEAKRQYLVVGRSVFPDDANEQIFEGGGRVGDGSVGGAHPRHELPDLFDLLARQAPGFDLGDVANLQEVPNFAQRLHFALKEDGDAVADVLN